MCCHAAQRGLTIQRHLGCVPAGKHQYLVTINDQPYVDPNLPSVPVTASVRLRYRVSKPDQDVMDLVTGMGSRRGKHGSSSRRGARANTRTPLQRAALKPASAKAALRGTSASGGGVGGAGGTKKVKKRRTRKKKQRVQQEAPSNEWVQRPRVPGTVQCTSWFRGWLVGCVDELCPRVCAAGMLLDQKPATPGSTVVKVVSPHPSLLDDTIQLRSTLPVVAPATPRARFPVAGMGFGAATPASSTATNTPPLRRSLLSRDSQARSAAAQLLGMPLLENEEVSGDRRAATAGTTATVGAASALHIHLDKLNEVNVPPRDATQQVRYLRSSNLRATVRAKPPGASANAFVKRSKTQGWSFEDSVFANFKGVRAARFAFVVDRRTLTIVSNRAALFPGNPTSTDVGL